MKWEAVHTQINGGSGAPRTMANKIAPAIKLEPLPGFGFNIARGAADPPFAD
jgi:hypothetical protein